MEDCLKEEKALEESTFVPTWMPTTPLPSYEPMAFSFSEETGEKEESAASLLGYSSDFTGTMMDAQSINDVLVRRALHGSSSAADKVHQLKASSKSRVRTINNIVLSSPLDFFTIRLLTHKPLSIIHSTKLLPHRDCSAMSSLPIAPRVRAAALPRRVNLRSLQKAKKKEHLHQNSSTHNF